MPYPVYQSSYGMALKPTYLQHGRLAFPGSEPGIVCCPFAIAYSSSVGPAWLCDWFVSFSVSTLP